MTSNASLVGASMLLVVLLALLGYILVSRMEGQKMQGASVANPASTNCINLGGRLEIGETAEGQVGYCHLPDGRVCEEWSLMRGACSSPQ